MGGQWIEKPKTVTHTCDMPEVTKKHVGRAWRCDDCGKAYRVFSNRLMTWTRAQELDLHVIDLRNI